MPGALSEGERSRRRAANDSFASAGTFPSVGEHFLRSASARPCFTPLSSSRDTAGTVHPHVGTKGGGRTYAEVVGAVVVRPLSTPSSRADHLQVTLADARGGGGTVAVIAMLRQQPLDVARLERAMREYNFTEAQQRIWSAGK